MVTVAHVVENIVERRPFLEEAIAEGIINYAALAEKLKPEVEKELKKNVKQSAIMMALRRLSEKLKESFVGQAPVKFRESDLTIKSDLAEITFVKSPTTMDTIRRIYSMIDFQHGDFLTVTQGIYEVTVIVSKKYKKSIEKVLLDEKTIKSLDNLSSLTIKIPVTAINTVGVFYVITKSLNWANINIVEAVSTFTELTVILKEDDISLAFNVMKGLINAEA